MNPHDIEACARTMWRALAMPLEERKQRHAAAMTVLVLIPLAATLVGVLAVTGFMFSRQLTITVIVCFAVALVTVPVAVVLGRVLSRPRVRIAVERVTGAVLIGLGVRVALADH